VNRHPKQGEKFTEFYILGPGGKAEDYPTALKAGETGTVTIGVVNHEYRDMDYTLDVLLGNESIGRGALSLAHNQDIQQRAFVHCYVERH